jgi:hypothetical protein
VKNVKDQDVGDEKKSGPGNKDMPRDAGGEPAEAFDNENEQDGLGAAQVGFRLGRLGVDQQERFADRLNKGLLKKL